MKEYIGIKLIKAEPAFRLDGKVYPKSEAYPRHIDLEDGYRVVYKDGYESWSPKEVFEEAYKPTEDMR